MTYFEPVYCFECGLVCRLALLCLGLVKVHQWVGLINEIMNVNSLMVLKSNHCYQRNG